MTTKTTDSIDSQSIDPTRRVISASRSRRELMRQVSDLGMVDPVFDKDLDIQRVLQQQNIFSEDPPSLALEPNNEDASIASDKTADVMQGHGLDLKQFHQSLHAPDPIIFVAAPKPLQDSDETGEPNKNQLLSPRSSEEFRLKKTSPTSSKSKQSTSQGSHSANRKSSKSSGQKSSKKSSLLEDLNMSVQSLDLEQALQMESEHSPKFRSPQSRKAGVGKSALDSTTKLNASKSSLNQMRSSKSKAKDDRKSKSKSSKTKKKQPFSPAVSSPSTLIKNTPDMDMDQLIREAALAYSPSTPKDNDLLMEALESSHTSLDAIHLLSGDDKQESLRSLVESGRLQQQAPEAAPNSLFESQLRSPTIAIGKSKPAKHHRAMPNMQNIFQNDDDTESSSDQQQLSIPEQRHATIKALVSSSQHKKTSLLSTVDDNADSHKKPTDRSALMNMSSPNLGSIAKSKKKGNKLSNSFNALSKRNNVVESATATASAFDESMRSLTSSATQEPSTPGRARRLLNTLNRSAHFGRSDVSQSPARQRGSSRSLSRGRRNHGNDDSKTSPLGDKLKGLLGKLNDDDDTIPRRKGKGLFHKSSESSPGSSRGIFLRPGSPRSSSRNVIHLASPPQPPVDPDMVSPTRSRRTLAGLKASTNSLLEL